MAILLGLLVALSYGAGDFLGGLASRRNRTVVVVAASQGVGLAILVVVVALTPGHRAVAADVVRGAGAGAVGLVGLVLLYRGLAAGAMSVIAPVTAVGAAILPLGWGLATGERPGALALVGVVLALGAVVLVSAPADETAAGTVPSIDHRRELVLALGAGAAFGFVYILLGGTGDESGLWPVLAARLASVSIITLVVLASGSPARVAAGSGWLVIGAGILDVTANALFVAAAREGLLSLVAVLSSLYPATTVLLARLVLHERVDGRQQLGLLFALGGVVLIATG